MTNTENLRDLSAEVKNALKVPVVLVGMMGTGKTHIGSELARLLALDFYDSDQEIERRAGMSVTKIFESFGEEKFRSAERGAIADLLAGGPCVIATGGGAVTSDENLQAIKTGALSVWLDTPVDILAARLADDTSRPLLQTGPPEKILQDLLNARMARYNQADIRIQPIANDIEKTLQKLLSALHERLVQSA